MKQLRYLCSRFEEILMMTALSSIVIVMFLQVIMRYVFKASLSWSDEFSRYCFIWLTFLGMSYAIKNRSHIRIDILETFIPVLKKPFEYIGDAFFLAFAIYMLKPALTSLNLLWNTKQTSPAMEFPMFYVYISLFLGFILIIIRIVEKYFVKLLNSAVHKKKTEENHD